jgi:predicted helicase
MVFVLTDTFQLGETKNGEDLFSEMFHKILNECKKQQKAPLRVIIGNPPYSIGQKSAMTMPKTKVIQN